MDESVPLFSDDNGHTRRKIRQLPVNDSARQLSLYDQFSLYKGLGLHATVTAPQLQQLDLKSYLISRQYGPAKPCAINPGKIQELLLGALVHRPHQQDASDLRHRLDDQYAGHNRLAWKVTLKECLVDGDVLEPYDPLSGLDFQDSIDQKEGVTMRKHLLNVSDIHHWVPPSDID
jgi:hypothetical protein